MSLIYSTTGQRHPETSAAASKRNSKEPDPLARAVFSNEQSPAKYTRESRFPTHPHPASPFSDENLWQLSTAAKLESDDSGPQFCLFSADGVARPLRHCALFRYHTQTNIFFEMESLGFGTGPGEG